jgi:hypothetical protein
VEYTGLTVKFKVNRPLSEREREERLDVKRRLDQKLAYQLSVTRLNSTYLETADKFYGWRGFLTFIVGLGSGLLVVALGLLAWGVSKATLAELIEFAWLFLLATIVLTSALVLAVLFLRKESFAFTHYPIRFNRKNRTVYVFRHNGTVLEAKWDNIFFTLGRGMYLSGKPELDIRAHILDADGTTVRETFALGTHTSELDFIQGYWELIRRYMEDGPQAISPTVEFFMPIVDRKETVKFSLYRVWAHDWFNFVTLVLFFPLAIPVWLGRLFAMHTSKIPEWPAEVEAACRIEPGDPFERDARHNPPDMLDFRWGRKEPGIQQSEADAAAPTTSAKRGHVPDRSRDSRSSARAESNAPGSSARGHTGRRHRRETSTKARRK